MKYIYVGKIVNTHALKGEVRLISDFDYKEKAFKVGNTIYLGQFKNKEVIETYRCHKQFDMIKFVGIDYINDVLKYKGDGVYIDEETLNLSSTEILSEEYPNMQLYNDEVLVGNIQQYRNDNGNAMLKVNDKYIPYNKDFITKIDKENKKIYMHDLGVFL